MYSESLKKRVSTSTLMVKFILCTNAKLIKYHRADNRMLTIEVLYNT